MSPCSAWWAVGTMPEQRERGMRGAGDCWQRRASGIHGVACGCEGVGRGCVCAHPDGMGGARGLLLTAGARAHACRRGERWPWAACVSLPPSPTHVDLCACCGGRARRLDEPRGVLRCLPDGWCGGCAPAMLQAPSECTHCQAVHQCSWRFTAHRHVQRPQPSSDFGCHVHVAALLLFGLGVCLCTQHC
jgi:hypothetical protein